MKLKMKMCMVIAAAAILTGQTIAYAEEAEKPTASVDLGAFSQYVWRGLALSKNSLVIQSSVTVGYKGVSLNVWGNLDTDKYHGNGSEYNETDITLSYTKSIGIVNLTGGYIYYGYGLGNYDTQEFYVSASYDTLLKPTLTVYRDTEHYAGWYITAAVSYSLPLVDKITMDLGAKASYLKAEDASSYSKRGLGEEACDGFHDGVISAAINFPVNTYITITPQVAYSFPLTSMASDLIKSASLNHEDPSSSFIYGGVAVSLAF